MLCSWDAVVQILQRRTKDTTQDTNQEDKQDTSQEKAEPTQDKTEQKDEQVEENDSKEEDSGDHEAQDQILKLYYISDSEEIECAEIRNKSTPDNRYLERLNRGRRS